MKLTKKQRRELYNCHPGAGTIFINISSTEYVYIDINLGRDGNWYAGSTTLSEFLQDVKEQVKNDLE